MPYLTRVCFNRFFRVEKSFSRLLTKVCPTGVNFSKTKFFPAHIMFSSTWLFRHSRLSVLTASVVGVGVPSRPVPLPIFIIFSSRSKVRPLLSEAKPSCVYLILKPHGKSSRSPVRLLLSEAKPSYVYSILKPHGQSFRNPNCCSKQHSITSPCGFRIN